MRGRRGDIEGVGAKLVFVGNGAVHFARNFQENEVPGFEVYTDPSRESYRALGLKRSVRGTLGPRALRAGLRSTLAGHVQTSLEGDGFQLGGFFAVARGGKIVYAEVFSSAGDRPNVDAALAALGRDVRPEVRPHL